MILASLCNTFNLKPSGLVLISDDLSSWHYVKPPVDLKSAGVMGLSSDGKWIAYAEQASFLVVVDRHDFSLRSKQACAIATDVHSVLIDGERILLVGTSTNVISEMPFNNGILGEEKLFWNKKGWVPAGDHEHLNSICRYKDRILVSGFGKKKDSLWSSAKNGFVIDTESGAALSESIYHPHSLSVFGSTLWVCESSRGRVVDLVGHRAAELNGYTRGLCEGPAGIYVGVSRARTVSKSTGVILNPADPGEIQGTGGIHLLDRSSLGKVKFLDLGEVEIYDLLWVGNESLSWPRL